MTENASAESLWQKFDVSIYISATLEDVWQALATPAGQQRWLLKSAKYETPGDQEVPDNQTPQLGSSYVWEWQASEFVLNGQILKVSEPYELSFTFGPGIRVLVELELDEGQTRVRLTQEGMPESTAGLQMFIDCYGGWTFYLTNLKSVMEGGLDLREKTPGRGHLINM